MTENHELIVIGMPVLGNINPLTVLSLYGIKNKFPIIMVTGKPIEMARNMIVDRFMRQHRAEYLLFIDSDMTFTENDILNLFNQKKSIISAVCHQRYPPYQATAIKRKNYIYDPKIQVNTYQDIKSEKTEELMKVDATGAAFLMINRKVFRAMPEPYFEFIYNEAGTQLIKGEDIFFCDKAQHIGYNIYIHTGVTVGHLINPLTIIPDVFNDGYLELGQASKDLLKSINVAGKDYTLDISE